MKKTFLIPNTGKLYNLLYTLDKNNRFLILRKLWQKKQVNVIVLGDFLSFQ